MAFLTTSELDAMRTHAEALLVDTCTIEQRTMTMDSIGGWTESWAARGTAIPCRLTAVTTRMGNTNVQADRLVEGKTWMLTLAHDQEIATTDRVTVGGHTYQVRGVNDDDTERILCRALLERAE